MPLGPWLRTRKTPLTAGLLSVVLAVPVTLAALHQGIPIADVDLFSRDVWVTNSAELMVGRLNAQIGELNSAATITSREFDVLQEADDVFVHDSTENTVQRIDTAEVRLDQRISVPPESSVRFGGNRLTIVNPDGQLWILDTTGELVFDPVSMEPFALGSGGDAVVSLDGRVLAYSPEQKAVLAFAGPGATPEVLIPDLKLADYQLSAVGDEPIVFDVAGNRLVSTRGGIGLPLDGLRIQQPGPEKPFAIITGPDAVMRVTLGGAAETLPGVEVPTAASRPEDVAAPVVLGDCINAAWSNAGVYYGNCGGAVTLFDIVPDPNGNPLAFRVNRDVVVLNDLANGDSWLVDDDLGLVDNWNEVTPPDPAAGTEVDTEITVLTFNETIAERTPENHYPEASPDELGARPGRSAVLPVLDNDLDQDGDVLTISGVEGLAETSGTLQVIDSGRALQFEPADGTAGSTASFTYTVSDGRGGVASASVNVAVRPLGENTAPASVRTSGTRIEVGQTVTANVLTDWIDPDGDDLQLLSATPLTADIVRFTPDGLITFTNSSPELGQKTVEYVVFDGTESITGELVVEVVGIGELDLIGVPDFATGFVNEPIEIHPLDNDRSPSGAAIALIGAEAFDEGIATEADINRGVVTVNAGTVGTYYLQYELPARADGEPVHGLVRVDVTEDPDAVPAPIAVKDVAYIRPNEPTTLAVLDNDQGFGGRVLGVQTIDTAGVEQLSIEVLNSTNLRITAPSGLTETTSFTYTISDGEFTAAAVVVVVFVPELTKHQAPIASDDTVTVRAGDIATVPVLANDFHSDGALMLLDPELVETSAGDDGLAFVTGDRVRLQAPTEPGTYSATYRIYDAFNESAVARVTFTVLGVNEESNTAPNPEALTARVFQGSSLTVEVPLFGIDPDGDSVSLVSATGAALGDISGSSSSAFTYRALETESGTDEFVYTVRDAFGATATGTIRIAVIPRADTVLAPSAIDDAVSVRPGRTTSVDVMSNDSDPNGYPISIEPELLDVQEGLSAQVEGEVIVVEAPEEPGTYSLRYGLSNGEGGRDEAFVTIEVDENAPLQPPYAVDHVLEVVDIVGLDVVEVDVLDGARNPGGVVADLVVSVEGSGAAAAEPLDGGNLRVTLTDKRQVVAYRLTNEIDELSAMAFVVVPPKTDNLPPTLKQEYIDEPLSVAMNSQRTTWAIADLLDVPSGRDPRIIEEDSITVLQGEAEMIDEFTLGYTPAKDFRGQVLITFTVTDGDDADDPDGNVGVIELPVIVGDAEFKDVPPTFANTTIAIEAGEDATAFDLRDASSHPNPAVIQQLNYSGLTNSASAVSANISGSVLSVSAALGTPVGTTSTLTFTVALGTQSTTGQIEVMVVDSTRPLAQAIQDTEPEGRSSSTYTIRPLENDFNPFADKGTPLEITGVVFEGATLGANISNTTSTVTVNTSTTKSGTISLIYTVRDATDSASREVQGRITVVVASAPEPVTAFVLSTAPQTVNVVFDPPSSSNGADITQYEVLISGAPGATSRIDCLPGQTCSFTGRTNGQLQTVSIAATNKVGTTLSSSQQAVPYGIPSAPQGPAMNSSRSTANSTITPVWGAPADDGGGQLSYEWNYTQGTSGGGSTTGTAGGAATVGAGDYAFQVRACNPAGCSGYVGAGVHVNPPPPNVQLSWGAQENTVGCTSAACRHLHITATGFTPGGSFQATCHAGDPQGSSQPAYHTENTRFFDGSGNWSGDLNCVSGTLNTYATVNGYTSNHVNFN
jgi:hypothetical protein